MFLKTSLLHNWCISLDCLSLFEPFNHYFPRHRLDQQKHEAVQPFHPPGKRNHSEELSKRDVDQHSHDGLPVPDLLPGAAAR